MNMNIEDDLQCGDCLATLNKDTWPDHNCSGITGLIFNDEDVKENNEHDK